MRAPLLVPLAALAAASLAAPLAAQRPAPVSACKSIQFVPDAYTDDTLFLALDPGYGIRPVGLDLEQTGLAVIADSLVLPKPLPIPPVLTRWSTSGGGSETGARGVMAEAFVELDGKGKAKRVGLSQTSLAGPLDDALVAAVKAGVNNGAFMAFEKAARGPGGFVFVQLRTVPMPSFKEKAADFVKQPFAGTPLPQTPAPKKGEIATFPVSVVRIPVVRLTSGPSVPKPGPSPAFPMSERGAGQDGFVNVEFVIGGDGHLVPGTLRLANAMTAGYAKAVMKAIERYDFVPAMAGDCGIPARLAYTFTFDLY